MGLVSIYYVKGCRSSFSAFTIEELKYSLKAFFSNFDDPKEILKELGGLDEDDGDDEDDEELGESEEDEILPPSFFSLENAIKKCVFN